MAIKVIAQRREVKLGKKPGMKFVMRPDLYIPIQEKKVFAEASTHSGISSGVIKAAWDAAGEVLRTWATEGHSVPLPGLGTMRFGGFGVLLPIFLGNFNHSIVKRVHGMTELNEEISHMRQGGAAIRRTDW